MENPNNIFHTCPEHSSRPQAKYAAWDPNTFLEKWVKMGFSESGTGKKEHLWIKVEAVSKSGKSLIGLVDNDPVLKLEVKHGDSVEVLLEEIESCFDGEKII